MDNGGRERSRGDGTGGTGGTWARCSEGEQQRQQQRDRRRTPAAPPQEAVPRPPPPPLTSAGIAEGRQRVATRGGSGVTLHPACVPVR